MKSIAIAVWVVVALSAVSANAQIRIEIPLPVIHFEAPPPLVVIQPGIQVVEDYDDEIYFVDNWYWFRRGPDWFRARDHRGGWVVVEPRVVPRRLVRLPPGQYRHWKGDHRHGKVKHGRGHGKHGRD